jgi:hypothetical protein
MPLAYLDQNALTTPVSKHGPIPSSKTRLSQPRAEKEPWRNNRHHPFPDPDMAVYADGGKKVCTAEFLLRI